MASTTPSGVSADYKSVFTMVPRGLSAAPIAKTTFAGSPSAEAAGTVVRFVTKEEVDAAIAALPAAAKSDAEKDFGAGRVSYEGETRVVSVSIGPAAKVDASGLRKASVAAVNKLRGLKVTGAVFELPKVDDAPAGSVAETVAQAVVLTNYHFSRYLTVADKVPTFLTAIHFAGASPSDESALRTAVTLAECTIVARDLNNERADEMNPARLEEVARAIAGEIGAEVTVVAGEELLAQGLHLLYSVGQAARHAPRYIELSYKGDPSNPSDTILLVGKGITYDTGGLNIKGTGFMEDMHMDMGGAAAVLGSILAAGRLGIKRNIVAVATVAENAIDGNSYKPHAVIRSHKGLTVQIGNTDAEGRLALADALSFGQSRHKPHTIIDCATLTGACIVGLGEYAAGLFTNNATLKGGLLAASEARFERVVPLPIFPEHREELKAGTQQADLSSTGAGRYGGACTAAAFLENFIGGEGYTPAWSHVDLAGPAMLSKPVAFHPAKATGFGVQLLTQYLLSAPAGALPVDTPKRF